MNIFAIGLAVFTVAVCLSVLITENRRGLSAANREIPLPRRHESIHLEPSPLSSVATGANAMVDDGSRSRGDVDVHSVEAESDLKESDDIATPSREGVNNVLGE
jgi:hypothetical protein